MQSPTLMDLFGGSGGYTEGPLLVLDDVSVSFGGVAALREISLTVGQGELLAVIGPNGAGKTTLLNCICGLARMSHGRMSFNGVDTNGRSTAHLAKLGLGRSFQDPPLVDEATVLENVLIGAHLDLAYRMADQLCRRRRVVSLEADARRRARLLLDAIGLGGLGDHLAGGLPYGSRKLVDIARALISHPRLLLLDEPTSGLDGREQQLVRDLLEELRRTPGSTVLIVEHHMDVVRAVATGVIGLQAGSMLAKGTPQEVLDSELFRAAIVGGVPDLPAAESVPADNPNGGQP